MGLEPALLGVQFNAVAQKFAYNRTGCSAEVQTNPGLQEGLKQEVPLCRLFSAEGDALYTC